MIPETVQTSGSSTMTEKPRNSGGDTPQALPNRGFCEELYDLMASAYGPQSWWPGDSVFEIMVGAILTQNTQWTNVEKAIQRLKEMEILEPRKIASVSLETVKTAIKDAGCYNQKAARLKNITAFLLEKNLDFFRLRKADPVLLRDELLQINGIGKETADSILLYALGHPVFVVDAYTKRLFSRLRYRWMATGSYDEIQEFFYHQFAKDTARYNEFHALIVFHSKYYCRSRPGCAHCILKEICHHHHS